MSNLAELYNKIFKPEKIFLGMKLKIIAALNTSASNIINPGNIVTVAEIRTCEEVKCTSLVCKQCVTKPVCFYYTIDGKDNTKHVSCYWTFETLEGRKVTNKKG
jgi:hypothetical protein